MKGFSPVRLAYDIVDPAGGSNETLAPMIFLHGVTFTKENWAELPQIVANGTKRKAYVVDARNHGDSDWTDDFNFDMNIKDLFHFMDTHKIPKAVIIGHSMGGITGIRAALQEPERVENLIVEDMFVKIVPKEILDAVASYGGLSRKAAENLPTGVDKDEANSLICDYILQNKTAEIEHCVKNMCTESVAVQLKRNSDGQYTPKANLVVIEKALRDRKTLMSEAKGIYEGPACFIYGEQSPYGVKADEPHIRNFFPKAEFIGISRAFHVVHTDAPAEFSDAVMKHLNKVNA